MRRTTSALTTAVLGAVLTASMVSAQQLPGPDNSPQAKSSPAGSTAAPKTASEAANSQLYGMTASRGARHLLRNGLDYLGYQQYDRALNFLREAEKRQKELNDAERLVLKQGIESAQRGLRKASDAETPYAISERSRPSNGFTPARPGTGLAANTDIKARTRKPKAKLPASTRLLDSDADDQGVPIRLTSSEVPAGDSPADTDTMSPSNNGKNAGALASSGSDQPRRMPEIPQIPMVSQLPDLTKADGSEAPVIVADPTAARRDAAMAPAGALPGPVAAAPAVETQAPGQAPQIAPPAETATADLQTPPGRQSLSAKPAAAPVVADNPGAQPDLVLSAPAPAPDPVPRALAPAAVRTAGVAETPVPLSEPSASAGAGTAPAAEPSQSLVPTGAPTPPAAVDAAPAGPAIQNAAPITLAPSPTAAPAVMPAAAPAKPAAPAEPDPAPAATKTPQVIDVETVPATTSGAAPRPVVAGAPAHQETDDVVPASMPGAGAAGPSTQPAATPGLLPVSPASGDDLPPLPADLGRPADAGASAAEVPAAQPASTAAARPAATGDDDLPPLPRDLGRSGAASPASSASPAQTMPAPAPLEAPTAGPAPAHTEQEPIAPLPTGSEERPAQPAPGAESPKPDAGPAAAPAPTAAGALAPTAPEPTVSTGPGNTDLPPLPGSAAASAATAPIAESLPATSGSPEPLPTPAAGTGSETAQDVATLPPAIASPPGASSTDEFLPNRAAPPSTLRPDLMREVETIARRQEDDMRRQVQNPQQPAGSSRDTMASDLRTQTQLDISRAPSPAEARPIKAIPVPEDWVPLPPRNWTPQRKYWAAAATCHLPLYFQDPVLERYGHSVEQFVGPIGRFLTYPVDDPTQSTQRNQILQPFFSAGLMGLQIIAWPYNLLMDPPWEAQYDLGYYRPGDNIPTDLYWLPLHGYGPPLHGSNY